MCAYLLLESQTAGAESIGTASDAASSASAPAQTTGGAPWATISSNDIGKLPGTPEYPDPRMFDEQMRQQPKGTGSGFMGR